VDTRRYRAGDIVEDRCRACKIDRLHTVIVSGGEGRPVRVQCDYCGSQHNFRGGVAGGAPAARTAMAPAGAPPREAASPESPRHPDREPFSLVSERECVAGDAPMDAPASLEPLLRRIIREESGLTSVVPADRWRGGTLVLRPGNPALQEKAWPIETFFHKVVMIRNRLRTLEQQVNASDLPEDAKVRLQTYITGCYGSLTSFNVLFADEDDQFKGSGE
jgi:hypothetical protein